ncbi:Predicted N-acyltransferase, GNAT family [Catalinimonas alkaloidigena]|uniref:Predicted N-acyltransferase, GNAT family n=1 Tax=Catalinimonas alkaloidigena TaxID=1075417 RepID=A0A1G9DQE9_9BACT|nr:GNAT family N-acetyltransferase [Catalinimonas alkaloidigena]SDK66106.1 Predicted N-acyltransferase, GNAT family [Catalinimonas alkaloidigena]
MIRIIQPQTPDELRRYYRLRYEVLRKPWGQPEGSEQDNPDEHTSQHFAALDEDGETVAVCRLHLNNADEAQVRYMGVSEKVRGQGVGKQLLSAAEMAAKAQGAKYVMLHARENAVPFYKSAGYHIIADSYLLFGTIQHYQMRKEL